MFFFFFDKASAACQGTGKYSHLQWLNDPQKFINLIRRHMRWLKSFYVHIQKIFLTDTSGTNFQLSKVNHHEAKFLFQKMHTYSAGLDPNCI